MSTFIKGFYLTSVPLGTDRLRGYRIALEKKPVDKRTGIEKANEMLHKAGFTDLSLSSELYKVGAKDIIPFLVGSFETRRKDELNLLLASHKFKELLIEGFLVGCVCPDYIDPEKTIVMVDLQ